MNVDKAVITSKESLKSDPNSYASVQLGTYYVAMFINANIKPSLLDGFIINANSDVNFNALVNILQTTKI